jgi:hypothetical protein
MTLADPITEHYAKQAKIVEECRTELLQASDVVGGRDAYLDRYIKVVDPQTGFDVYRGRVSGLKQAPEAIQQLAREQGAA